MMKITQIFSARMRTMIAVLILAYAAYAHGEEESIVLDPLSGNYVISYQGIDLEGSPKWHRVTYVPATKINPTLRSKFRSGNKYTIKYDYNVQNSRNSKQAIDGFDIRATHIDAATGKTPEGWSAIIAPGFDNAGQENGFIAGWSFKGSGGLTPGKVQRGFGFESSSLPGIVVAKLTGYVKIGVNGFPDEGPGDDNPVYADFRKLLKNDFVPYPVAAPRIVVSAPYDGSSVLDTLRAHVTKNIVEMKLIDPILAAQIDRSLQAAAEAVRRNSPKTARGHLQDVMKLLKKDHPDCDKEDNDKDDDEKNGEPRKAKNQLIDRLAAQVIAFDIKYVEKRLKK